MERAMRAVRKYGGHVQASVCYTLSPVHSNEGFVKTFKELLQIGADWLCIKDMGGLISPTDAYDLVVRLKAATDVPISLHSHYTSGMGSMSYLKAIEAGADFVDCALSPFALGTSQPATEALVAALEGHPRDTGINKEKLFPIADHFRGVKKSLAADFKLDTAIDIDTKVLVQDSSGVVSVVGNYGALTMQNTSGETSASTIMGNILFDGPIQAGDKVRLEADHGSVSVNMSADSALEIQVRSTSGDVTCILPGISSTTRTCDGTMNSGEGSLSIRTVSGAVTLQLIP